MGLSRDRRRRRLAGHHNGVKRRHRKFEPRRVKRKQRVAMDMAAIDAIAPEVRRFDPVAPPVERRRFVPPVGTRNERGPQGGYASAAIVHEYWSSVGRERHIGWHPNLRREIEAMFRRLSGCASGANFKGWSLADDSYQEKQMLRIIAPLRRTVSISWKPISRRPCVVPQFLVGRQIDRVLSAVSSGAETSAEVAARTGLSIKSSSAWMSQLAKMGKIARQHGCVAYYSVKAQASFRYQCPKPLLP
jgi:hypothetical protein